MASEHTDPVQDIARIEVARDQDMERARTTVWTGSALLLGLTAVLGVSAGLAPSGAVAVVICASTLLVAFNFALLGHLTRAYVGSRRVSR